MNFFKSNIAVLSKTFPELASLEINTEKIETLLKASEISGYSVEKLLRKDLSLDVYAKAKNIKLLILDVDGVMTDGGMYFTENGDQFKKYNTKDGMGIIHLTRAGFQIGIISSGFKGEAVRQRAELLGIQHFYLGRGKKIDILNEWCEKLGITLENVAMIGDDVNDLQVLKSIGLSACPADAVSKISNITDIILNKPGGAGCVREFIDEYLDFEVEY